MADTFTAPFDDLPDCLLLEIFSKLSQKELLQAQLISKRWRTLAKDRYLWRYCDFSAQSESFLWRMASSSIITSSEAIKIVKSTIPVEFLASALANKSLKALCLRQSRLKQLDESLKGGQAQQTDVKGRNLASLKSKLKFLDAKQIVGDTNIMMECVFYEGGNLEALGELNGHSNDKCDCH